MQITARPAHLRSNPSQLAAQIKDFKNPRELREFLSWHQIPIIGTQVFYEDCPLFPRRQWPAYQEYKGYAISLLRFPLSPPFQIVLLEQSEASMKKAQEILAKEKVGPRGKITYLFSSNGSILDPKQNVLGQEIDPAIFKAVRSGIVFSFGLYAWGEGGCVLNTQADLQLIAKPQGISNFVIATNPLFDARLE